MLFLSEKIPLTKSLLLQSSEPVPALCFCLELSFCLEVWEVAVALLMRCFISSCGCVWVLMVFYWELPGCFEGSLIIKLSLWQSWWKCVLSLPHCRVFFLVSLALISSLKNWLRELNLTKTLLLYRSVIIFHSEKNPNQLRLVSSTEVLILMCPFYWIFTLFYGSEHACPKTIYRALSVH